MTTRSFQPEDAVSSNSSAMSPKSHLHHWRTLDLWLRQYRDFWEPAPFTTSAPRWLQQVPALREFVEALSREQCEYYQDNMAQLAAEAVRWMPGLGSIPDLITLAEFSGPVAGHLPTLTDTPRRKSLQTHHFVAATAPLQDPIVDWCCGKGHLARALSCASGQAVFGLEKNEQLVSHGNRLATRFALPVRLQVQDVMAPTLTLAPQQHVVALHACGELHRHLLRKAVEHRLVRISFSPCCYHLGGAPEYRPLSKQVNLATERCAVSQEVLRMAVQDTVTAPLRVQQLRRLGNAWRLGFDGLQRNLRQVDAYLPLPSHPTELMHGDFRRFCEWAAAQREISLGNDIDFSFWEDFGRTRALQVGQHELVRHLFRRPLEIWLVLDYVLFLEEHGYEVHFGAFCPRELTPRNLLVDAYRA